MSGDWARGATLAWWSFRGSLRGSRLIALGAFASVPSLVILALLTARPGPQALANAAESLFASLTLPVAAMVVVLVVAVAQFRNEIDNETLVYISDRSIPRATVVVGKFLGAVGASLVLVLPSALAPLAIAELGGGTAYPSAAIAAIFLATVLAVLAYVAVFLFVGLATPSALIIGLLFGFLWEGLLPLLPGDVPKLTLIFYLRSLLSGELTSGPLSGYASAVSGSTAVVALLVATVGFLILGIVVFRTLETVPDRQSA